MKCIHPKIRVYRDIMGVEHSFECPCGHCIACLHNLQDSWSIRLQETCNRFKDFVYDTLTFAPVALSYRNITDKVLLNGFEFYEKDCGKLFDRYSVHDRETGEMMLLAPFIEKKTFQNWIKRGRENYFLRYGKRCNLKYFLVEEFGPKTSRPHAHLLMFGLSRADYVTFFAKPWRREFGFTRTKYIEGGTDKDRSCICRYLSKYVSKGVFESPLVKYGLIPKPFRLISKGIGVEYLDNSCFDFFKNWKCDFLKSISVNPQYGNGELERTRYIRYCHSMDISPSLDFSKLGWRLTSYYDSNGFVHALPRYYRNKLVNASTPNLLSYALSSYLLENARVYHNTKVQEFARKLGLIPDSEKVADSFAGFGLELYDLLCRDLVSAEKIQSRAEVQRRFIKLKNHFGRAINLSYAC